MTTEQSAERIDFVVLHPAGGPTPEPIAFGVRRSGESLFGAVSGWVPNLSSQGMGRLRAWFSDDFGTDGYSRPNPQADRVLRGIGYMQEHGFWRGTVALSMEESPDGATAPMPAEVVATIVELAQNDATEMQA